MASPASEPLSQSTGRDSRRVDDARNARFPRLKMERRTWRRTLPRLTPHASEGVWRVWTTATNRIKGGERRFYATHITFSHSQATVIFPSKEPVGRSQSLSIFSLPAQVPCVSSAEWLQGLCGVMHSYPCTLRTSKCGGRFELRVVSELLKLMRVFSASGCMAWYLSPGHARARSGSETRSRRRLQPNRGRRLLGLFDTRIVAWMAQD
ncbi:hypothetical protein B0H65DRAFT_447552 [Neurospora tetraspora]|uniref:Uncharacterized protein n=1 Tax=Neurospora tetraspora TaxID=94610 RepID=A0AAE0JMT8_9PEZI|nr:hypothetical protein B0H65DRAFT_447552 [Neurospora tetraspora]